MTEELPKIDPPKIDVAAEPAGPAWAQTLAGKQIRMLVPFPAGGGVRID